MMRKQLENEPEKFLCFNILFAAAAVSASHGGFRSARLRILTGDVSKTSERVLFERRKSDL